VVPEERVCAVDGVPVRCRVAGDGPPTVFVHGLAGSSRWWDAVVTPLGQHLEIYLVDLPGFGTSRGRRFVLADAPGFVRAVTAQLGLDRVHLVGHSLGGAVCARVAARWPALVDRLVLAAPAGLLERRHPLQYVLPLGAAIRHARPTFLRMLAADALRAGVQTVYRAGTQLLADKTDRDELATVVAPTLLVWGERDPLVPLRLASDYERAIPGARLVVLAGAGHVPMSDRPEEFALAVAEFLRAD
jgi:pimeloyl-ACP methyl ester carboxylesterase